MPVLFVSHSSKDDAVASALEAWLRANRFTDIFVDHLSIAGGDKWGEALRASASACRVIVCLVSENWLASPECFNEFLAAWYMGKRIIPLFLLPQHARLNGEAQKRYAKICSEVQGIDLADCFDMRGSLQLETNPKIANRLKAGLRAAGAISLVGLDPQAFAIDSKLRPTPFPGLASFGDDDADAALFYGRSREIADTLEDLRKMRAERDLRPFVILGASGAGKSSLLKAGIIPRLRREAAAWLPLRAFRPGADPLLNFAEALSRTLDDFGKVEAPGEIRDRLFDAWSKTKRKRSGVRSGGCATLEEALEAEGCRLREAAGRGAASILISVDQAEELTRAEGDSGEALADYLRVSLATSKSRWQVAFTIRSDSFPKLQSHHRFQGLEARGYDLRAIPVFRFDNVVEEPARRYGVEVEHVLVDALMEDAPKEDALPLLAFALQRLWRQYAASGTLTKDNYHKVGGLAGLIEDAAERALRGLEPGMPLPSAPPAQGLVGLAASTFVPTLAQVNEHGATIRHVAEWGGFNEEQRELLRRFDRWRLVVRKGGTRGGTVEVAHEALFREWTRLKSWLEPERARLDLLRSLQIDASTWGRNGKETAFLNHRDKRLAEANALSESEGYRKRLGKLEFEYLAACEAAERLSRRRTRRMQAVLGVLAFGVVVGLIGWLNQTYLQELWREVTTIRPYMLTRVRPHVLTPSAERALKPGDSFRECAGSCPEMVVVPAGAFLRGSPANEVGRYNNEGPQHEVVFAKPFAVSKFEVTFDEWDVCAAYGNCDPAVSDSGWGRGRQPVINVTWDDAQRYVAWFTRMTGKRYRLLSEAEWEYAARAGSQTAYSWGHEIGKKTANCNGCGSQWDGKQTAPVGSFAANAFGLHDMHGNVWEWVEDCVNNSYEGAPTDGSAWMASGDCGARVVRGGSWINSPLVLRSANRSKIATGIRNYNLGFRIGRILTP
jgi:formylglycine-generating enzyme required for sulfatase activity